jgi:hypothetical protein
VCAEELRRTPKERDTGSIRKAHAKNGKRLLENKDIHCPHFLALNLSLSLSTPLCISALLILRSKLHGMIGKKNLKNET